MLDAYRGIGFEIPDAFGTSIVLAIIGAQIWLDDVDDYRDDVAEGQLTPVTAEYVLAGDDATAYENVVSITERYLDLARAHAEAAGSPLNGIAIEYILRSGEPGRLPGSEA
jgi:nucleotide-binding universal stress UspA family protein